MQIPSSFKLIVAAVTLVAASSFGWYVNGLVWEKRSGDLLDDQEKRLTGQCKDQKKLTEEIDNATLSKLSNRDSRVAGYNRLHQAPACVTVTAAASNSDAASGGRLHNRSHAVTDHALVDYAAVAEGYRAQLIGSQDFIKRVWESK